MKNAAAAPAKTKAPKYIPVDQIDIVADIRTRCKVSEKTVEEYKEAMNEGSEFPPGVAFMNTDGRYVLADGEHRYMARVQLEQPTIPLIVYDDDRENAISLALEYSLERNGQHGLRRSTNDKHLAVKIALADKRIRRFSDKRIAGMVGVSPGLVAKLRSGEPEEKPARVPVQKHDRKAPGRDADEDPAESGDPLQDKIKSLKSWLKEGTFDWQTCFEVCESIDKASVYLRLPKKGAEIVVISKGTEKKIAVREVQFTRGQATFWVDAE